MQWGYKRSLKLPLPPAVVSLLLHTETFRLSVTGSFQSMLPINKSSPLLKVSLEIFRVFSYICLVFCGLSVEEGSGITW